MVRRGIIRALTGLAAGACLTALLLVLLAVAWAAGMPFLPFTVFAGLIRVLPGAVVTFGLDATLGALRGLGLDVASTAKTAEQVLAVFSVFLAGLVVGLVFFAAVRGSTRRRRALYGVGVGGVLGAFSVAVSLTGGAAGGMPTGWVERAGFGVMAMALFLLWGWGLGLLSSAAIPGRAGHPGAASAAGAEAEGWAGAEDAEVRVISRRRFLIQMGGLAATIAVAGAGVGAVLRAQTTPEPAGPSGSPVELPNAGSPVVPAPGTRREYTPVADHYRVDIDLTTPDVDPTSWRLTVDGLVNAPLSLSLEDLRSGYANVEQFATLSCISNPLGGPFIGTTLWTGVSLRNVLEAAGVGDAARFVRMTTADGFDEEIDLGLVRSDPRIILAHSWDRQPLTRQHGFPLRVFIPDRYGMKQPKWITALTLAAESTPGYWVSRGWDERGEVKTISVIDTVAVKSLVTRDGQTFVPMGGMAYSGAKGISRVEIQVDDGPWEAAELRQPLSDLAWVLWRWDWPFSPGTHQLAVRAYDGRGQLQETRSVEPSGVAATGLYSETRTIEDAGGGAGESGP